MFIKPLLIIEKLFFIHTCIYLTVVMKIFNNIPINIYIIFNITDSKFQIIYKKLSKALLKWRLCKKNSKMN
jgi:hypothetical protein